MISEKHFHNRLKGQIKQAENLRKDQRNRHTIVSASIIICYITSLIYKNYFYDLFALAPWLN